MEVKRLRLGSKDFEERRRVYEMLAGVYIEGKRTNKPLTLIKLVNIADDARCRLHLSTLMKYVKKAREK